MNGAEVLPKSSSARGRNFCRAIREPDHRAVRGACIRPIRVPAGARRVGLAVVTRIKRGKRTTCSPRRPVPASRTRLSRRGAGLHGRNAAAAHLSPAASARRTRQAGRSVPPMYRTVTNGRAGRQRAGAPRPVCAAPTTPCALASPARCWSKCPTRSRRPSSRRRSTTGRRPCFGSRLIRTR